MQHELLILAELVYILLAPNKEIIIIFLYRSSLPKVFCKNGVLKKCVKFSRKQLCQSLFFKRDPNTDVFL